MLPRTMAEPRDDPAFLSVVDLILAVLVSRDEPTEVYLVSIDNWFDHKWLTYSGYGGVPFYTSNGVALAEHHQDQLTFPPFTPNRVVAQYLFCRVTSGGYEEQAMPYLIHRRERQRSSKDLHRRVPDFSHSALFVWYSSRSTSSRRGSILVYAVRDGDVEGWYAGFSERKWLEARPRQRDKLEQRQLVDGRAAHFVSVNDRVEVQVFLALSLTRPNENEDSRPNRLGKVRRCSEDRLPEPWGRRLRRAGRPRERSLGGRAGCPTIGGIRSVTSGGAAPGPLPPRGEPRYLFATESRVDAQNAPDGATPWKAGPRRPDRGGRRWGNGARRRGAKCCASPK